MVVTKTTVMMNLQPLQRLRMLEHLLVAWLLQMEQRLVHQR
jgi:hypothetical protein